jgi:hypothetical protein
MFMKKRVLLGMSILAILCSAALVGAGGPPSRLWPLPVQTAHRKLAGPPLGDLLLSRSVYSGTASTVTIGQALPGGGTAVADGTYPGVWANEGPDSSFGVTSPIFIDRGALAGTTLLPVGTLAVPPDQVVTSFSSKSELALHLSTDGRHVTFMAYVAPVNTLDVSNSNTPGHVDPTNPVALIYPRAVAQIDARGGSSAVMVTPVNTYSGNNGRSAILDSAGNQYFTAGNAGNGGSPEPVSVVSNTGVQLVAPGGGPETTVVGVLNGTPGAANGFQYGFAVQLLGDKPDKSGKDDNFRGLTIFDQTLYVTKGSGGNGINTVYQVGTQGTLPTSATAAATPISILPGFSTVLAKSATGVLNPFGIWFADQTTLYVADEGAGTAAANPNAGLQKWVLQAGVWQNVYTLQNGLDRGVKYGVPGLAPSLNPATDGLRSLTGRVNGDGTVTLFAVTSTVSASVDQGADPNRLVTLTDTLSFKTALEAAGEAFTTLRTAAFGEALRGVEFVPLSARRYAEQLVEAALVYLDGLPEADFRSREDRHALLMACREALDALEDRRFEEAEAKVKHALRRLGGITDPGAEAAVLADLTNALGAIPEDGDRDSRDGDGRRDRDE